MVAKTLIPKWLFSFMNALFLIASLTACSSTEGEDNGNNPSKPDVPISNDDWQTVPTTGGTIEKDNISISFPSGTFAEGVKVAVTEVRKGEIGGEFEASKFYQIAMPCTANKPITIKMKSNEINDNNIFIAQANAYCQSRGTVTKAQLQYETTYSNGEYTTTIPALKGDVDGENEFFSIGLCNINSEIAGTRGLTSYLRYDVMKEGKVGKVNYQIRYSLSQKHKDISKYNQAKSILGKIDDYVQQALTKINDLGFKLDAEQTLYIDFDPNDKDWGGHKVCGIPFAEGFAMWVSLGVDKLTASTTTDNDIKCTVIHEIFHWFQSFFDTRSNYKKSRKEYHGDEMVMYEMGAVWIEQFMNNNKLNENFLKDTPYKFFNNNSNLGLIDYVDIWKVIDESGAIVDPYGYQGYSLAPLLYYLCSTKEFESWKLDNKSVYELHQLWKSNFGTKTTVEIMEKWLKGNHDYDFFYGNKIDDYYLKLFEGKLVDKFSLANIKGTPDKSCKDLFSEEFDGKIYPFGCEAKRIFIKGWGDISLKNSELVVNQMEKDVQTYLIVYDETSEKYINIKGYKAATVDDPIVLAGDNIESLRLEDGSLRLSFYLVTTRISNSTSDKGTKSSKCSIEIKNKEEEGGNAKVEPDKVEFDAMGGTNNEVKIFKGSYKHCGVDDVQAPDNKWLSAQGTPDGAVTIEAKPNMSLEGRKGEVKCWVSNKKTPQPGEKKYLTVNIIQNGVTGVDWNPKELKFTASGGSETISFEFGGFKRYGAQVHEEGYGWCGVAAANGKLTVTVQPNETKKPRECIVDAYVTNSQNPTEEDKVILPITVYQEAAKETQPSSLKIKSVVFSVSYNDGSKRSFTVDWNKREGVIEAVKTNGGGTHVTWTNNTCYNKSTLSFDIDNESLLSSKKATFSNFKSEGKEYSMGKIANEWKVATKSKSDYSYYNNSYSEKVCALYWKQSEFTVFEHSQASNSIKLSDSKLSELDATVSITFEEPPK